MIELVVELIEALGRLVKWLTKLTPIGLFGLCLVLTLISLAVFPNATKFFAWATVVSSIYLAAWGWMKMRGSR